MIEIYFDDAGSHSGSQYVAYAGIMGGIGQWGAFNQEWSWRLNQPISGKPPLRRFHMTECMAKTGEFASYNQAERDLVTREFRQIIIRYKLFGFAASVPVRIWDEIIQGTRREKLGNAEMQCFQACVSSLLSIVRDHMTEKRVHLIFDGNPEKQRFQNFVVEVFSSLHQREAGITLQGPTFDSSYNLTGLQAADMFAWESNNYARDFAIDQDTQVRPHLRELQRTNKFRALYLDRRMIERMAKDADDIQI